MGAMSTGHAVAETLAQLGVGEVFGMVGSCMIEILDGMYGREDLHFLTVRHEQSAALMADAFAAWDGELADELRRLQTQIESQHEVLSQLRAELARLKGLEAPD